MLKSDVLLDTTIARIDVKNDWPVFSHAHDCEDFAITGHLTAFD